MIRIEIPFGEKFEIKNLVFDYNGTVAVDGIIIAGFFERLRKYSDLGIYVITADTYGTVKEQLKSTNIEVTIISKEKGSLDKLNFVKSLGSKSVMAFGNGSNDRLMLEEAGLGICIIGNEGASVKTLMSADMVVKSLDEALDLIDNPDKIIAGLRE
ncbi:MAG: HAD hydrolase family protein [Clostridiales bacterium]|nr:HAD hydrolase family protein [Clostridiales bacterium]